MATDPAEDLPYFFLGYAHSPGLGWVRHFYQDLCAEIVELTDWPTHIKPGFMDESGILAGEDWRHRVARALATCRVFVPLYSRRYFTREECGREWHAFQKRLLDHRARQGGDATPIVPVLWTPVAARFIPPSVRDVHVDFRSVSQMYQDGGLYGLIKNQRFKDEYLEVVSHIAQRIIDAAEGQPLNRSGIADIDVSQNAFEQPMDHVPAFQRLKIMVCAPTLGRVPGVRADDDYGEHPQSWTPFRHDLPATLAETAAAIARAYDYTITILPAEDGLSQYDWTDTETGLGLVLVDPWLAMDPAAAELLRRIDGVGIGRVATIVVWNMRDPQTHRHADEIHKQLHSIAPRLLGDSGTPAALGSAHVHSADEFTAALPQVLHRTANRYLNSAQAQPPLGSTGLRPQLFPPGTSRPEQVPPEQSSPDQSPPDQEPPDARSA